MLETQAGRRGPGGHQQFCMKSLGLGKGAVSLGDWDLARGGHCSKEGELLGTDWEESGGGQVHWFGSEVTMSLKGCK